MALLQDEPESSRPSYHADTPDSVEIQIVTNLLAMAALRHRPFQPIPAH
jgi:hypothetical protein